MSFFARYPVTSAASTNPSVGPNLDPIPLSSTLIGGEDPSGDLRPVAVDASGNIIVGSSALPVGAATEAKQDVGNASLSSIDTKLSSQATAANQTTAIAELTSINTDTTSLDSKTVVVDTSNVQVASSALPTGASTEAKQDSTIAAITAFSDKTAGSLVPEAFDYQLITYVGATTDIDTVTYKTGGAGGSTVATLTMGYDGSNRLSTVTRT